MSEENKTLDKQQNVNNFIAVLLHRTWKILLISGIIGLVTELLFMIVKLAIVGNQVEGKYATIWFASSMLCLALSGIIASIIYGKPYIIRLRNWVYEDNTP